MSLYASTYENAFAEWAEGEGWAIGKRGWPDFLCVKGGRLMAVEVKGGNDFLRPDQIATLTALNAAGMPTFVWTPESGLRPYPGPVALVSVAALEQRIAELETQLRAVVAERDDTLGGAAKRRVMKRLNWEPQSKST